MLLESILLPKKWTASRHEAGMRDISLGRHVSKPTVRFNDSAPSVDTSTPVIRATNNGKEPSTYTVSQMTDIMKLMSITTPSPSTPEAKPWRGRDKSPAPGKPWRSRGESPSPYNRDNDKSGRSRPQDNKGDVPRANRPGRHQRHSSVINARELGICLGSAPIRETLLGRTEKG